MKKGILILVCFILAFNLYSCKNMYNMDRMPPFQPDTFWMSEDCNISFYVHSFDYCIGKMDVGDEPVEVKFYWTFDGSLKIYSLDILREARDGTGDKYLLEEWFSFFINKDTFIAFVKESTYFEKGDVFVLKKTDVGDNEIVYPPEESAPNTEEKTGDNSKNTGGGTKPLN